VSGRNIANNFRERIRLKKGEFMIIVGAIDKIRRDRVYLSLPIFTFNLQGGQR